MKKYYKIIDGEPEFFSGNILITEEQTYISPSEQILLDNGWMIWEEPELSDEILLQRAKTVKLGEIDEYDNSTNVNLFYLGGVPMWLDAATRQQLKISIEAYVATGAQTVTKWFEGQQFTFPINAWIQMLSALEVYASEALNVTEAHKADIMAMTNIEDITNYDITQGYPEKLNLSIETLNKLG